MLLVDVPPFCKDQLFSRRFPEPHPKSLIDVGVGGGLRPYDYFCLSFFHPSHPLLLKKTLSKVMTGCSALFIDGLGLGLSFGTYQTSISQGSVPAIWIYGRYSILESALCSTLCNIQRVVLYETSFFSSISIIPTHPSPIW
jgi:hypothetical protein